MVISTENELEFEFHFAKQKFDILQTTIQSSAMKQISVGDMEAHWAEVERQPGT